MQVKIKKLHPDAVVPKYLTPGSAGFDLVAVEDVVLEPGETKLVKTGLALELPLGYELQIRPRSGVTLKTKLRVANSPGTVDSDYRGEIGVIVDNITNPLYSIFIKWLSWEVRPPLDIKGNEIEVEDKAGLYPAGTYIIQKGDRIAQGVISPVVQVDFEEVDELSETKRGTGGFGSTGVN